MKKLLILLAALLSFELSHAQFVSWGLKVGGNTVMNTKLNDFKDIPTVDTSATSALKTIVLKQGKKPWGLHAGAFARIKVLAIYIQPELLFTQSKTEINIEEAGVETIAQQKFNKFDIPVMIGAKFGPARVNVGPVATFVISETGNFREKMNEIAQQTIVEQAKGASLGLQIGLGLDLLKILTLDLRYEFGLSKLGKSVTIMGNEFKTDQRTQQLFLSVGVFL